MSLAPVTMPASFAQMPALISAARVRTVRLSAPLASSPLPSTRTVPCATCSVLRLPSLPYCGLPVVKTARLVLMKPPPFTRMPSGLATTTEAALPATSINPLRAVGRPEVTSFTMTLAVPRFIWGLPCTYPASCVCVGVYELLRTAPRSGTLKSAYRLRDTPPAVGAVICTRGTPFAASCTRGCYEAGACASGTMGMSARAGPAADVDTSPVKSHTVICRPNLCRLICLRLLYNSKYYNLYIQYNTNLFHLAYIR